MSKYKIWLDDVRPLPETWNNSMNSIWYSDAESLIRDLRHIHKCFSLSDIAVISLDNDLGEGRLEGYKVLDWLEETGADVPFGIHIHTSNPVARERMRAIIERNGWKEIK